MAPQPKALQGSNGPSPRLQVMTPAQTTVRYTNAPADAIEKRICAGESLRSICEEEGMPDEATASWWMELRAHSLIDEVMDLANSVEANPEALDKARAKIEALRRRVDLLLPEPSAS